VDEVIATLPARRVSCLSLKALAGSAVKFTVLPKAKAALNGAQLLLLRLKIAAAIMTAQSSPSVSA
jgi:hypothetical protein